MRALNLITNCACHPSQGGAIGSAITNGVGRPAYSSTDASEWVANSAPRQCCGNHSHKVADPVKTKVIICREGHPSGRRGADLAKGRRPNPVFILSHEA